MVILGVIEMLRGHAGKSFFDGPLDTMIEYIEKHSAFVGLSISHREYVDDYTEVTNGKEAT